jgi:hypothetical protein
MFSLEISDIKVKETHCIVLYQGGLPMNVNGISDATYTQTTQTTVADKAKTTTTTTAQEEVSAVYEGSTKATKATYTQDTATIDKLKADAEARTAQLRSLVEKMLTKQGQTIGTADDMWKFLAKGDFTVDAATKAQAQEDISEDGYWGVEQTSDRIIDFAKALTGGDPDLIDQMQEAFEKGFSEATKSWGKELPEISQKTYDAVIEKFEAWRNEANGTVNNIEA